MSIDTTPPGGGTAPAGESCPLCYGGSTPDIQWCCFAGIEIGNNWAGPDPPPPNGPHGLIAIDPCHWFLNDGNFTYDYQIAGGNSILACDAIGIGQVFRHTIAANCRLWFSNQLAAAAGNWYYSGFCMVVPPIAGGSWSIPELLELISTDPEWAQWLNPRPASADRTFYNLYDRYNSVNVKISLPKT